MLQPEITQELREALSAEKTEIGIDNLGAPVEEWFVAHCADRSPHNFQEYVAEKLCVPFTDVQYTMHSDESSEMVNKFFQDCETLEEDMEPLAEVYEPGWADTMAELYDFGEYLIERSDSGLGVYFK